MISAGLIGGRLPKPAELRVTVEDKHQKDIRGTGSIRSRKEIDQIRKKLAIQENKVDNSAINLRKLVDELEDKHQKAIKTFV